MALARMLHKKIAASLQVNKLSINARLLFTWMIAHADDYGRLNGEPERIKALVVPMTDWSFKEVEEYLQEITKVGLIHRWANNEELFIEFPNWEKYQHIREDRRKDSIFPPYPHKKVETLATKGQPDDNQAPAQSNVIQSNVNKSELNPVEQSSTSDTDSYKRWKMAPSDPDEFVAMDEGEQLAHEAWSELEPENKFNFKLTYLKALYLHHLPPHLFREFINNIKQDPNVKKPGAVFNKKVQEYIEQRREAKPTNFS